MLSTAAPEFDNRIFPNPPFAPTLVINGTEISKAVMAAYAVDHLRRNTLAKDARVL